MTTKFHDAVVVEPNGFVFACSWCLDHARLDQLNRAYPGKVSHALCPNCRARLEQELEAGL